MLPFPAAGHHIQLRLHLHGGRFGCGAGCGGAVAFTRGGSCLKGLSTQIEGTYPETPTYCFLFVVIFFLSYTIPTKDLHLESPGIYPKPEAGFLV